MKKEKDLKSVLEATKDYVENYIDCYQIGDGEIISELEDLLKWCYRTIHGLKGDRYHSDYIEQQARSNNLAPSQIIDAYVEMLRANFEQDIHDLVSEMGQEEDIE